MIRLILGSQSPRRKEILEYFSLPFEQASPKFDERSVYFEGDPIAYVLNLSKGKAESLHQHFPKAAILTADTVVYFEGKVYNKPENEEEAFRYLSELAGRWHSVFTGMTLQYDEQIYPYYEETRVAFNPMTAKEIRLYHSKIHWADKAAGYAIQMGGGLIVRKIDGCYYNVMGLPINGVHILLKKIGIELWQYVK